MDIPDVTHEVFQQQWKSEDGIISIVLGVVSPIDFIDAMHSNLIDESVECKRYEYPEN